MIRNDFLSRIKEIRANGFEVIFTTRENFMEVGKKLLEGGGNILHIKQEDSVNEIERKIREFEIKVDRKQRPSLYDFLEQNS